MTEDTGTRIRPIAARVADRMRSLRGARGWTAQHLADAMTAAGVGWNRGVVTKLETGRRENITVDELVALAALFGVSPMELIGAEEPKGSGSWTETARLVRVIAAALGIDIAEEGMQ